MNKRLQGMIAGILIGTLLTGGTALAKSVKEMIEVSYSDIKIVIDGEQIDPRSSSGKVVEPFIYNGTTYLPVRAVGEAFGKEVSWDGVNKVVYLGAKPGTTESWLNVCGPYEYKRGEEYRLEDNEHFVMSGKKYTNGFVLDPYGRNTGANVSEAMFNLDGRFNEVSFVAGHVDDSGLGNLTMEIYIDGIIAYTKEIKYDDVARKITIPLNGALQMKIKIFGDEYYDNAGCGFSEGEFK